MTKANLPHAARGGELPNQLIGTAYTFRCFTHNYILSMIYSMRGTDGKFHYRNLDVFARSLAWMMVVGGLSALPFLDDLMDELEKFFGKPIRTKLRETMRKIGDEPLEQMGVAGILVLFGSVPGMVGVDMSGSIKIGLPSFTGPLKGPEERVLGFGEGLGQKATKAIEAASVDL